MGKVNGRRALSEKESKKLLEGRGIPVVPGEIARNEKDIRDLAERFGFPLAIKGHGEGLAHKTELDLVKLGVAGMEEALKAGASMLSRNIPNMDGILISPMMSGRREFIAGMFRDPLFGPVIMFGLGGIYAEALGDVVFRLAPLDEKDALEMIDEIRSAGLLGPFRGEAAVDRLLLIKVLTGLAALAVDRPDIAEVDINPLLINPDGEVMAVDALVVQGDAAAAPPRRPRIPPQELGRFFHPKSVVFIGASGGFGKWGHMLPMNLLAGEFPGTVWLVNPRGGELWGRKVLRSVSELPEAADLAVVTIPAKDVRGLLPALAEKGVRRVLLITSGFSETGGEGRRIEKELMDAAKSHNIIIFGPNTMGIQNPHAKTYLTGAHVRVAPGDTTLVSQSGNMGVQLLEFAGNQGIGIRAFAGSGNEAMVAVEDFMEAFEEDEMTRTVLLYIESVKDGRRFFESARRVGKIKPIVVLKGGRTSEGSRAAESHTGALAGNHRVFEAMCRQAGIISVDKPVEMLDASAVFSSLPLPKGKRVVIMTLGGGWGVVTSDLCSDRGLIVTPLEADIIARFDEILPPFWSRTNPVDLVGENDPEIPKKAIDILAAWEGCDAILHLGVSGRSHLLYSLVDSLVKVDPHFTKEEARMIRSFGEHEENDYIARIVQAMEKYGKPIIGVNLMTGKDTRTICEVPGSRYKAVFFNSPERAVQALSHMCRYNEFLRR